MKLRKGVTLYMYIFVKLFCFLWNRDSGKKKNTGLDNIIKK